MTHRLAPGLLLTSTLLFTAALFVATLSACGEDAEGPVAAGGSTGSAGSASLDAPAEASALRPFLESKSYSKWAAEADYHPSSGPHGEAVKVFYSAKAAAALTAGSATFPQGAAVIKELTSGGSLYGWAVWVKVDADSAGGNGLYWYELIQGDAGDKVYGDARGSSDCVGCHAPGRDYLLSDGKFVP